MIEWDSSLLLTIHKMHISLTLQIRSVHYMITDVHMHILDLELCQGWKVSRDNSEAPQNSQLETINNIPLLSLSFLECLAWALLMSQKMVLHFCTFYFFLTRGNLFLISIRMNSEYEFPDLRDMRRFMSCCFSWLYEIEHITNWTQTRRWNAVSTNLLLRFHNHSTGNNL